ncbi:MAG: hypothetical protein ACHQF2_02920 [Flavobacteriales bacterium]
MRIDSHQHFWKYNPVRDGWITKDMLSIRRDFYPADLKPILQENKIDGCYVDLHNEYDLTSFTNENNEIQLCFQQVNGKKSNVLIVFKNILSTDCIIEMSDSDRTIDNFHRGRFDVNGTLKDVVENRMRIYLEFLPEGRMEISCEIIQLSLGM